MKSRDPKIEIVSEETLINGRGSKSRTPTKIPTKMGGAPLPKWDPIGFDHHSQMGNHREPCLRSPGWRRGRRPW